MNTPICKFKYKFNYFWTLNNKYKIPNRNRVDRSYLARRNTSARKTIHLGNVRSFYASWKTSGWSIKSHEKLDHHSRPKQLRNVAIYISCRPQSLFEPGFPVRTFRPTLADTSAPQNTHTHARTRTRIHAESKEMLSYYRISPLQHLLDGCTIKCYDPTTARQRNASSHTQCTSCVCKHKVLVPCCASRNERRQPRTALSLHVFCATCYQVSVLECVGAVCVCVGFCVSNVFVCLVCLLLRQQRGDLLGIYLVWNDGAQSDPQPPTTVSFLLHSPFHSSRTILLCSVCICVWVLWHA